MVASPNRPTKLTKCGKSDNSCKIFWCSHWRSRTPRPQKHVNLRGGQFLRFLSKSRFQAQNPHPEAGFVGAPGASPKDGFLAARLADGRQPATAGGGANFCHVQTPPHRKFRIPDFNSVIFPDWTCIRIRGRLDLISSLSQSGEIPLIH